VDRIDFRSDTVTWPTPAMREAMAAAPVGDDVFGEDPTVNELEALAAAKVGKEAGLFVTSGTQGNLVAVLGHGRRGDEAILGYESHVFQWEVGGIASYGGILPHPIPTDEMGRMDPTIVERRVRDTTDHHYGHSRLLLVENTFGGRGGTALPPEYFATLREVADRHGSGRSSAVRPTSSRRRGGRARASAAACARSASSPRPGSWRWSR